MKLIATIVFLVFLSGVLGHGVQILSPNRDHSFNLQIDELKKIVEVDDIKDRYVFPVSIAGAFRQGKSFLLNFFLKFLEAQVIFHTIFILK